MFYLRKIIIAIAIANLSIAAIAQSRLIPKEQIPKEVLGELMELESRFERALYLDCDPKNCYSRGCVHRRHEVIMADPNAVGLPGINSSASVKKVKPSQFLLSGAQCEFAVEKSIDLAAVRGLTKRLERKLSKGYLQVKIKSFELPEAGMQLKKLPKDEGKKPKALKNSLESDKMLLDLWNNILPNLHWMAAILLVTFCLVCIIWAFRRVGKESLESKLLAQQLQKDAKSNSENVEVKKEENQTSNEDDRILKINKKKDYYADVFSKNQDILTNITEKWLDNNEFEKVKRAGEIFGARGLKVLPDKHDFIQKKILFRQYIESDQDNSNFDEEKFLSEIDSLTTHIATFDDSSVAQIGLFVKNFSPKSIAAILAMMPEGAAIALFVMLPSYILRKIVPYMARKDVHNLAKRLCASNRVRESQVKTALLWISSLRQGRTPSTDAESAKDDFDSGACFNVTPAISILMQYLPTEERKQLVAQTQLSYLGRLPGWLEGMFFPEMLRSLDKMILSDIILEVDANRLGVWLNRVADKNLQDEVKKVAPKMLIDALSQHKDSTSEKAANFLIEEVENQFRDALIRRYRTKEIDVGAII